MEHAAGSAVSFFLSGPQLSIISGRNLSRKVRLLKIDALSRRKIFKSLQQGADKV
jgi:hypothetical protein